MNKFKNSSTEKWMWLVFGSSVLIGQGVRYTNIYAAHVCLFLIIIFNLYQFFLKRRKLLLDLQPIWFFILFFLYSLFSLAWTPDPSNGLNDIFHLGFGLSIIALLTSLNVPKEIFKKSLLLVYTLNLILSVLEAFNIIRWPLSTLVVNFEKQWEVKHLDLPSGFFWNPNNNALFVSMFLPWVFYFSKGITRFLFLIISSFVVWKCSSKIIMLGFIPLLGILFICWGGECKARVRGLALGCLVLIVSFLIYTNANSNNFRTTKYLKTIDVVSLFLKTGSEIAVNGITGEKSSFDFSNYDQSLHERLVYFEVLITQTFKAPFFGGGAGSLNNLRNYKFSKHMNSITPHFYFMEFWAKFGGGMLLLYFVFIGTLIKKLFRTNVYGAYSLIFFTIFNVVLPTASYFLPMWYLFAISIRSEDLQL